MFFTGTLVSSYCTDLPDISYVARTPPPIFNNNQQQLNLLPLRLISSNSRFRRVIYKKINITIVIIFGLILPSCEFGHEGSSAIGGYLVTSPDQVLRIRGEPKYVARLKAREWGPEAS